MSEMQVQTYVCSSPDTPLSSHPVLQSVWLPGDIPTPPSGVTGYQSGREGGHMMRKVIERAMAENQRIIPVTIKLTVSSTGMVRCGLADLPGRTYLNLNHAKPDIQALFRRRFMAVCEDYGIRHPEPFNPQSLCELLRPDILGEVMASVPEFAELDAVGYAVPVEQGPPLRLVTVFHRDIVTDIRALDRTITPRLPRTLPTRDRAGVDVVQQMKAG